jgi:hypothetical protein
VMEGNRSKLVLGRYLRFFFTGKETREMENKWSRTMLMEEARRTDGRTAAAQASPVPREGEVLLVHVTLLSGKNGEGERSASGDG